MRKLGAGRIIASIILIIVALGIGIVPSKLLLGGNDGGGSVAGSDPWGLGLNGKVYKTTEKLDADGNVIYQQARHKKASGTYMYRGDGSYVYIFENSDGEQFVQVYSTSKTPSELGFVIDDGGKLKTIASGDDDTVTYLWAKASEYAKDPNGLTEVRTNNNTGKYQKFTLEEMTAVYENKTADVAYDAANGRYATIYSDGSDEYVIAYVTGEGYVAVDGGEAYTDSEDLYEDGTYRFVKYTGSETYVFASLEEMDAAEIEITDALLSDMTAEKQPLLNQIVGNRYAYLNLYETAAPWETDAKIGGAAFSDAALVGNTITVINPYSGEEWMVEVPSNLPNVAWDDMTEDEQAAAIAATDNDVRKLALALYYRANYNYIMADYSGNFMNAATSNVAAGIDNAVDLTSLEFRKNGAYFTLTEIHTIRNSFLVDTMPALKSVLPLEYGERKYLDADMSEVLAQKTSAATIEGGKYSVPWADAVQDNRIPSSSEQLTYGDADEGNNVTCYTFGVNILDIDTVTVAYVAYVDGQFKIHLELDAKGTGTETPEAVKNSIVGVRDGAGDPSAQYQYVNYDMTLWQDGSFKSIRQKENWLGVAAGFEVNGLFDYYYVFFYGKENAAPEKAETLTEGWTDVEGKFTAAE